MVSFARNSKRFRLPPKQERYTQSKTSAFLLCESAVDQNPMVLDTPICLFMCVQSPDIIALFCFLVLENMALNLCHLWLRTC